MQDLIDRIILKLPSWLRWILVLPIAFLADLAAQVVFHLLFSLIPIVALHPYTDELAWRFFAPLVFVMAGIKMAPRHWLVVACVLITTKGVVALINIVTLVTYLNNGGSLSAPAEITNAPVWWSMLTEGLFIAFGVFMMIADRNIRKTQGDAQPILDF